MSVRDDRWTDDDEGAYQAEVDDAVELALAGRPGVYIDGVLHVPATALPVPADLTRQERDAIVLIAAWLRGVLDSPHVVFRAGAAERTLVALADRLLRKDPS